MRQKLYTTNCIVTGKPATIYTGHVIIPNLFVGLDERTNSQYLNVSVIAGFCDNETCDRAKSGGGCFGDWKPEYGIKVEE
jgi:hypothetical protein